MRFSSPLLATVQSVLAAGQELEVPEALLATMQLPYPLQTNKVSLAVDLRGTFASCNTTTTINQGASSGPTPQTLITFDRGLYQITVKIATITFVGPAASSASATAGFAALVDPTGGVASRIALTGLAPLTTWISDYAQVTVQFNIPGWTLQVGTFVASGVGQSMAFECACHVSRLL